MTKYIDLIAYPIGIFCIYILMAFVNWNKNPEHWLDMDRIIWVIWGVAWGWALSKRIKKKEEQ